MRLINIHTLELKEFFDPPPYAILSHRWIGREIAYEQFIDPTQRQEPGFDKIARFCSLLRERPNYLPGLQRAGYHPGSRGVEWAWVDTCCIDKRSSAELSESINSMWQWYWNAEYCVAWLQDIQQLKDKDASSSMRASAWFLRGWTLQEMLAPVEVFFCDREWHYMGTRTDLCDGLSLCTGIPAEFLRPHGRDYVQWTSVAKRMSWASKRKTTRPEDEAYCLFGLFGVNLPLLYGEGSHAFIRLQEEIIRKFDDDSILAWMSPPGPEHPSGVLATSPAYFELSGNINRLDRFERRDIGITNHGVQMRASLMILYNEATFLALNCFDSPNDRTQKPTQCLLALAEAETNYWSRVSYVLTDDDLLTIAKGMFEEIPKKIIYLRKSAYDDLYYGELNPSKASKQELSWQVL